MSFDKYERDYHAYLYGIAPLPVKAIIKAESNFNPSAISPKGTRILLVLMQVPPITETRDYIKRVKFYYEQFKQQ